MLNDLKLHELARKIFGKRLPSGKLERVVTEATSDSEGKDALRIVLVLNPATLGALTGDQALDLLVDLHDGLMKLGDDRFPIIEYATESDLSETNSDDSAADVS